MPETQTIPKPYRDLLAAAEDEFVRKAGRAIDTARKRWQTGKERYTKAIIQLWGTAYRLGQEFAKVSVVDAVKRAKKKYPDAEINGKVYKPALPEALIKRRANNVATARFTKLKTDIEYMRIDAAFGVVSNPDQLVPFYYDEFKASLKSKVAPSEGQTAFVMGEMSVFKTFRG